MSDTVERPPLQFELRDDDGMIVEYQDEYGNVTERHVGDSSRVLYAKHLDNACGWLCSFCYDEANYLLDNNLI